MTFGVVSKTSLAYDGPYPSEGDSIEEKLNVKEVKQVFRDYKVTTRTGDAIYLLLEGTNKLYNKRAVEAAKKSGAKLPGPVKEIVTREDGKRVLRSL